ncbi:MAG TPA: NnrU family protein [Candidatus Binataceae bacterium]|nr:NnrU family protein [Candidatus Binataceae bacterium]
MTTGTPIADERHPSAAARALTLIYGVGTYLFFFGTFLYLIGFVGNWFVPKGIDGGTPSASTGAAIVMNMLLLGLFAVQHTIMARPAFKESWTRIVPVHLERTTYVLLSTAILALMAWQWRPMPEPVWHVENPVAAGIITIVALAGWGIVLESTFLIDHFDLFGLKQTVSYALGRPFEHPHFRERLFYRWVRHPLMLGFMIAFWATPTMSEGHLLFAVMTTVYVLIAIQIEEGTLVHLHGEQYRSYQRRVPMLIPFGRRPQP